MTDDASPENLRKFLESDDPAMVLMGLSMAKGAGVKVTLKDLECFLKRPPLSHPQTEALPSMSTAGGVGRAGPEVEIIKTGVMLADEAGVGDEAIELLCESLADDDYDVKYCAAKALGELGEPAVEPIMDALKRWLEPDEEDFDVYDEAYCDTCSLAAEALGEIGDTRAVELLIEALGDGEGPGSWSAATALGEIGDTDAVEPLIWVLRQNAPSEAVREEAAKSLGKIGDTDAVKPLIEVLRHKHYDMRRAAAMALVEFGEQTVEPLIKMLDDDYFPSNPGRPDIVADGMWTLGEIGEAAVMPLITAWLEEGNESAVVALGEIGDAAVEPLIELLEDEDEYVRGAAKEALKKLDRRDWPDHLDTRQKWG